VHKQRPAFLLHAAGRFSGSCNKRLLQVACGKCYGSCNAALNSRSLVEVAAEIECLFSRGIGAVARSASMFWFQNVLSFDAR
jgi:radical SAM superfamily enzyme with C-terminal helix-hairpin-helix motif